MTKITLNKRENGIHAPIKECLLPGDISEYYDQKTKTVFEAKLIDDIPENWLTSSPSNILLLITEGEMTTGYGNPKFFRPWAKYFDCYSLELVAEQ